MTESAMDKLFERKRHYVDERAVYFIQAANGLIKIGVSVDPEARIRSLQTLSPVALRLLAVLPGIGAAGELELHRKFAADRDHGEWFHPSVELRDFIARVNRGEQPRELLPPPPTPEPPKVRPHIEPEVAAQLREMQAVARTVNGATAVDHPSRIVSVELAALLHALVEGGVTLVEIAETIGVTHAAVSARLARHGYREPAPSQAYESYAGKQHRPAARFRDFCKRDHPLSGVNLRILASGNRVCKACERIRTAAYRERKSLTLGGAA